MEGGMVNLRQENIERRIRRCKPHPLILLFDIWILLALLGFWLVIPLFFVLWRYLELLCITYYVTNQRVRITRGVLKQVTDEVELFRVLDIQIEKPLLYRFFSLANIHFKTVDRTTRNVSLTAITDAEPLFEVIRNSVLKARGTNRPDPFFPYNLDNFEQNNSC
jgi:uncharacterized membrane protein YdbT with pleckstrin-like domain